MNTDDLIWQLINKSFCSFMVKTKTGKFCRNEDNVTGLCSRHSCPLANSQYATIKERDGIIYLYIKAPERVPYPAKQWERIKLKRNEQQAIEQINKHLRYWDRWMRTRVKLRFLRTRDYLKRMRRLALSRQKKLEPINRKVERRENRREEKALRIAKLARTVENELLERIRAATNTKEIYNIDKSAFEQALEAEELDTQEMELDADMEEESENEEEEEIVYTSGSDIDEEEEENIEDFADALELEEEPEAELLSVGSSKKSKVKIVHEKDDD
ncbi:unnamed protein product [Schistocephalus solidus]|uniref:Protein MAK16 homolog n=1 Tax=Schistocephalus solidus TaxID=70667 RepID=A0A0X3PE11_SCHSO|nr:unnamed protein product [Schistocephalus solidus]